MREKSLIRVVALGNPDRGDDGAALRVAENLRAEALVCLAGRPGVGLLHLLFPGGPVLLMDVTVTGAPPGTIHLHPLETLDPLLLPDGRVSSHGFGVADALALARTLSLPFPPGLFLGIEGISFVPGGDLSPQVKAVLPLAEAEARSALRQLREKATEAPFHPFPATEERGGF